MSRIRGFLLVFAAFAGPSFVDAATADWAEEMDALPFESDKGWTQFEGNWGSTVALGAGTWINRTNNGNIGVGANPLLDVSTYTLEFRFRFLEVVPTATGMTGPILPIWVYNAGGSDASKQVARVRPAIGSYPGPEAHVVFEVPGADIGSDDGECALCERYNYVLYPPGNAAYDPSPWVPEQWYTARITMDAAGDSLTAPLGSNGRAKMYIDGVLISETDNSFVGQDDPGLLLGASDGGPRADVEWDYLRIKVGSVVPIGEALSAPGGAVFDPADFDRDRDVDAADFDLWQAGLGAASGATVGQGDADLDGDVDGNDFLAWQAQFGRGTTTAAASTPAPEPGTWWLLSLGAAAIPRHSRRSA